MRIASLGVLVALALAPTACVIHLGDDDDEPVPCATTGDGTAGAPFGTFVIDPSTLTCVEATFPCDGTCGPCDLPGGPTSPSWAPCQSQCTGLDEQTCASTPGCRQAWDFQCMLTDAICTLPDNGYFGCFAVDTTGPEQGACDDLDAETCSRHDDCMALYRRDERCSNAIDDDRDGSTDEPDECLSLGLCMDEQR